MRWRQISRKVRIPDEGSGSAHCPPHEGEIREWGDARKAFVDGAFRPIEEARRLLLEVGLDPSQYLE